MKFELLNHIMRFIVLSAVQIFVLNNIALFDFATPYLYLFFIIALPLKIPNWALLSVAFLSGLTIDVFTSTPGMHASACVTVAFIRPFLLELISPREGYGSGNPPLIRSFFAKTSNSFKKTFFSKAFNLCVRLRSSFINFK